MKMSESRENYLEAIYLLARQRGVVRSIDVADFFGFSRPSVSNAVSLLKQSGLVTMGKDGSLSLTEAGKEIAERTYERHRLLTQYFMALGVSEKTAQEDACRIEHVISQESFQKLKEHVEQAKK